MRSHLAIPCLAIAGLLGSLTAHAAAPPPEYPSRVVAFSDLNLASREGISRLYARIRWAAKEVCEPVNFRFSDSFLSQQHCEERAIEQAVVDLRMPQLTTFHISRTNPVVIEER